MTEPMDVSKWLNSLIRDLLANSPLNILKEDSPERSWDDFMLGFAAGDDPIFDSFKEHVGPFHWTPHEIFSLTFPELEVSPGELTVICWILPQRDVVKIENSRERVFPAENWVRSRILGEKFNRELRIHVERQLNEMGFEAVAPMPSHLWERRVSEKFGFASTWSERHAAYAAGLGTFGLSDGLITPLGKAMRVGSVVARVSIPPTPRLYEDHHEYCLFFSHGICGKCIERCPVGAITEEGHDKIPCREHAKVRVMKYAKEKYGFDGYGCGLCQTGVPCESGIPKPEDLIGHKG